MHEEGGDEGGDDRQDKIRNFINRFAFHIDTLISIRSCFIKNVRKERERSERRRRT